MSDKSAFTIFDLSASSLYKIIGLKLKQLIDGKKITGNLIKSKLFNNLSYYIVFIFLCY